MKTRYLLGLPFVTFKIKAEEIEAIIDTGFNGSLLLPIKIIERLNLEEIGTAHYAMADGAAITFKGSHRANLAFHKSAFCLATVPFELPETAPIKEQLNRDGIVMTLTGGWDVTNYREIYRLDILYAVKTLRPEWAVRVMG